MARIRRDRAQPTCGPRLFAPEELALRPTGQARLRALARLSPRPPTVREALADENREMMNKLRHWGAELARLFDLQYTSLQAEREGVTGHYGVCYEDGAIRIRLRHARTKRLLKESSLVDTLCHELAHVRYMNHGLRFRRLHQQILDQARRLGHYRPGSRDASRPCQGTLFDSEAQCTRAVGKGHATTL